MIPDELLQELVKLDQGARVYDTSSLVAAGLLNLMPWGVTEAGTAALLNYYRSRFLATESAINALARAVKRERTGMWFVTHGQNRAYNAALDALFGTE